MKVITILSLLISCLLLASCDHMLKGAPSRCAEQEMLIDLFKEDARSLRTSPKLTEEPVRGLVGKLSPSFNLDLNSNCRGYTAQAREIAISTIHARVEEIVPLLLQICRVSVQSTTDVSLIARYESDRAGAKSALASLGQHNEVCDTPPPLDSLLDPLH